MTRIGKKEERKNQSPRKHRPPCAKTGPLKDNLPLGYKEQSNAVEGETANQMFIGKVR